MSDYTSYSYLAPGDLPHFDLDPEYDRVPPYELDLDAEQTRRGICRGSPSPPGDDASGSGDLGPLEIEGSVRAVGP